MSPTTAPPTPAADAPARPPVGWSPGPLPLGTLAASGLPLAAATPPCAGLIPAPAADTLTLEVAALPAPEQVPAEWPHAGLHPAAAADGNGSGAALPPPAAAAPEALQGAPQATQEVAPAEQQARDAECAGAADGARGRLPKLSVFKGMGKAAAAAAAKLTDGERGGKARAASAGKGTGPDPKGAKPDQAPGGLDGPDSATAGDLGANPAGPPNPMEGPGEAGEGKADAEESDAVKAERSWAAAMGAGSLIHDLFRGQLQSSIECQTCKRRSTMCALYPIWFRSIFTKVCRRVGGVPITACATSAVRQIYDCQSIFSCIQHPKRRNVTCLRSTHGDMTCRYDVFWELSLPLAREAPSFPRSVLSSGEPKSVKHCLDAFFAGEKLEVWRSRLIA